MRTYVSFKDANGRPVTIFSEHIVGFVEYEAHRTTIITVSETILVNETYENVKKTICG